MRNVQRAVSRIADRSVHVELAMPPAERGAAFDSALLRIRDALQPEGQVFIKVPFFNVAYRVDRRRNIYLHGGMLSKSAFKGEFIDEQ